jgi:hypothetical protein
MAVKKQPATPGKSNVRRIVVYGRPSSGKTCYLASLAMARLPHPKGFSCVWVCDAQTISRPAGKPDQWNPHDPQVARYLGKEWLQKAIDALNSGDVPRANPNDVTPYRLMFDLTFPDGRIVRLEMIDYSGELVDPNLAEDMLAKQLLVHLEEADGVLVLAEAPKTSSDEDESEALVVGQYRELQVLQQALVLVAEKRRKGRADPIPMGMLLNKWDRYSKANRYDETAIAIEKDIFMERKPPVPQTVLFNVLKAVAGYDQEEPFSASFAVSAFGKTKTVVKRTPDGRERTVELPQKLTPLQSYGLEDPLTWVCDKMDQLEMRQFGAKVARLKTWKVWNALSSKALKVRAEIVNARKAIPAHLPQARAMDKLSFSALTAYAKQSAFAFVFFLALIFASIQGGVYQYDKWQYTKNYPALEAAKNDAAPADWVEQWKAAEGFLASYSRPAWYRWASHTFLMTPESARKLSADLQPKFEEATRILAAREEFDVRINGLVEQGSTTQNIKQIDELIVAMNRVNVPDVHPGGGAKKAAGLAKLEQRRDEIRGEEASAQLTRQYNGFMNAGQLAKAAEWLATNSRQSPAAAEKARADFQHRWHDLLLRQAQERSKREDWSGARTAVEDVENSPDAMKLTGPNGRIRCSDLKDRIVKHREETVYRLWYQNKKNTLRLGALMNEGNLSDRELARSWKEYDDFMTQGHAWTVTMERIYQPKHGGQNSAATRTKCYVNNNETCTATWRFDREPETAEVNVSGNVNAVKYDENISVYLHYTTTDFVFSDNSGSATFQTTMRELMGGLTKKIVTNRDGDPEVTLRAKLQFGSIPSSPRLRTPNGDDF